MAGAEQKVNDVMKKSQNLAGFEYADFETSIAKFDASFQVCVPFPPLTIHAFQCGVLPRSGAAV
jgi:hypothetical protein